MSWSNKPSNSSIPWFRLGLGAIFSLSLVLRFWGLGRFNSLVFDEVYYAKFANNYLTGTDFFNAHPPLSQYIIAVGIWIGSHLPFGQDTVNDLTGSVRSTWSYRWLNALTGSFVPLVIAGIAYQLNQRRSYALIAAFFAAADGLFLVESRYALNNIYLVILGLLGQLFFLAALRQTGQGRSKNLALSGIFFGASAAIKWNGLWFLLGVYLVWAIAWLRQKVQARIKSKKNKRFRQEDFTPSNINEAKSNETILHNLTELNYRQVFGNFALIPVLSYSLLWLPHLYMNPTPGFLESQQRILTFHESIGSGEEVHPYCSRWYTWPLMLRPVAYFYELAQSSNGGKVINDVHAFGNPILWWLSTAATLLLLLFLVTRCFSKRFWQITPTHSAYIALYLVFNWLANWLPWLRVTRCTFIYHYMGASVFSGLALAWIVDRWLSSPQPDRRWSGITVILLILLAFCFWMPIYLGLPLSPEGFKLRMWLDSWV